MEDFETRLQEHAKKYQSDWHHHRFAYSKDYTPESAFLAGARFGRAEEIERLRKELDESARLHALGAERELKLMTQLSVEREYSGKLREVLEDIANRKLWPGIGETMRDDAKEALALPMPEDRE